MDDILRFVWGEYRAWATTSRVLKDRITKIGLIVLCLVVLGTALGTLSPLVSDAKVIAWLGTAHAPVAKFLPLVAAVALGVAAYLATQLLGDSERQGWMKARALAEALKSESYKYVTRAAPYDQPNAPQLLAEKAAELQRTLTGVLPEPISDQDRASNLLAGPMSLADYIEQRVRGQITYFRSAISRHRAALSRAKKITLGAGIVAVVLSAGAGSLGGWTAPVLGIVTTVAATLATWFQSGRHQQIAQNYQESIARLELLLAQHRTWSSWHATRSRRRVSPSGRARGMAHRVAVGAAASHCPTAACREPADHATVCPRPLALT